LLELGWAGIRGHLSRHQKDGISKATKRGRAIESQKSKDLTSSPSLLSLGAETYARLRVRSCPGFVTWDRTTVSPDRTDFTRASRGMLRKPQKTWDDKGLTWKGEKRLLQQQSIDSKNFEWYN
jgi:hypothetical protein